MHVKSYRICKMCLNCHVNLVCACAWNSDLQCLLQSLYLTLKYCALFLFVCAGDCRSALTLSDRGRQPEADALLTTGKTSFRLLVFHFKLMCAHRSKQPEPCAYSYLTDQGVDCYWTEAASQVFHLWLKRRRWWLTAETCSDGAQPPPTGSQKAICLGYCVAVH